MQRLFALIVYRNKTDERDEFRSKFDNNQLRCYSSKNNVILQVSSDRFSKNLLTCPHTNVHITNIYIICFGYEIDPQMYDKLIIGRRKKMQDAVKIKCEKIRKS